MKKIYLFLFIFIVMISIAQAQWQPTNGPYGSTVIALDTNETFIFAGSGNGYLYKTDDNGANWSSSIMPVRFSIAVKENNIYTANDNEVYHSTDNGETYEIINTGLPEGSNAYEIFTIGNNILLDTENSGVVISEDGGVSWDPVSTLPGGWVYSVTLAGVNVFAGTVNGVYLSTDNGLTWIESGMQGMSVHALIYDGSQLYAGTAGAGMFISADNGLSWTETNNGLTDLNVRDLAINGSDIYAGTENNIFISSNNGNNWTQINNGLPHGIYIRSLVATDTHVLAGTSYNGVFISSDNGAQWIHSDEGFDQYASVKNLAFKNEKLYAGTSLSGLFISENNGDEWYNAGIAHGVYSLYIKENNIYAGTTSGVYLSTDNGNVWVSIGLENECIYSFTVLGTTLIAGTDNNGIYTSDNGGSTWTDANSGIPGDSKIYSLVVKGSNIFAGTYENGLYISTDNGTSWVSTGTGLPDNCISVLFTDDTNMYAGTLWAGIYFSTDNGANWTSIGLDGISVSSIIKTGNYLFASCSLEGVFYTTDNGLNWTATNTGFDTPWISSVLTNENHIFAGHSNTGGVWKQPLSDIISIAEYEKQYAYLFPNPVEDNFKLEIPVDQSISLVEIFDLKGKLLRSINIKSSEITVNVSGLPEGMYFVKMHMINNSVIKKIIKQ